MTTAQSPFPTVAKLAKECGATWACYEQVAQQTAKAEEILRAVLLAAAGGERLLDPDSSLVLCGSFARREMVTGSDCDWTLLINGVVNNHHGEVARLISNAIVMAEKENKGLKSPGTTGTFGNLTFSHDLVHRIGGIADTNENLTRRMLMLLESRPVSFSAADSSEQIWKAVLRCILERYFEEDVHFGKKKVPRFLVNDLTRYWRTICVDYAAKYHEQAGRKWAVRNAKLRFSRKLLFASGLAFCFGCRLNPPNKVQKDLFGETEDKTSAPFIDSAMGFAATPPLEYLAAFVDAFVVGAEKRKKVSEHIFGAYNEWLRILGDDEKRKALESLTHENAGSDATFQEIRKISASFSKGLKLLFFNREQDDDKIADLSLEYVGF